MENTQTIHIAFIGAGNVASHLATALAERNCQIQQIFSKTETSAHKLASQLKCPYTTNLEAITSEADLYIVSIKDTALDEVLPLLVERNRKALFVHTAGSVSIDIWKGLTERYGVLYPLQTFSKQRPVDFSRIPFFIEANTSEDTELLIQLAGRLSNKIYEATSEQRKYLHISAVFACNFTNHMYAICEHLLTTHNLPFDVMLPLIDETAGKIHHLSPLSAQTGPAQRYDQNIIDLHLKLLENEPQLANLYESLSKNIHIYATSKKEKL